MRKWWLVATVLVFLIAIPLVVLAENLYLPFAFITWKNPGTPLPATPTPDAAGERIAVPEDFRISIFAENLDGKPRFMAFDADGRLYVSLMTAGQVIVLPDEDGDGRADSRTVVADGLSLPHGMEWHDGWLYVAEGDRVERLQDGDGDGSLEVRELVTDNVPGPSGHSTRTVHFGPDGMMYVSAGSSCNICEEGDPRRATIMRFNPDGSIPPHNPYAGDADVRRRAVWAEGLRNSVDFLWNSDGTLWANHNGSDGLGDDAPPEEIIIAVEGGEHYGWPYCYTPVLGANLPPSQTGEVQDTRMALPSGFSCATAIPATFTDLAHSAPLGMILGTDSSFPAEYRDDVFVAYHGSWNTSAANARDCKVQRIVVENGEPVRGEDFANGWRAEGEACASSSSWGRPADVVFGPDGAMYISDDKGNRIYRVAYTGP